MTDKELTPAQKGAITRAKNKAAKEELAKAGVAAEKIEEAAEVVDAFSANEEFVELTVSKVTPRFNADVRNAIYIGGVVIGAVGTVAGVVATVATGEFGQLATSVAGLTLSLTNLLAKLNLSRPAEEATEEALG